jgi:hypothetical protein
MISPRIHTVFKEMNGGPDVPFSPGVSHFFTSQAGISSNKVVASFNPPSTVVGAMKITNKKAHGIVRYVRKKSFIAVICCVQEYYTAKAHHPQGVVCQFRECLCHSK